MEKLRELEKSKNFKNGKFQNLLETSMSIGEENESFFSVMKDFYFGDKSARRPKQSLPNLDLGTTKYEQHDKENFLLTWFGHSTVLAKAKGKTIIIDPVFSKRASPLKFIGPKKFAFEREYTLNDLPKIDIVLISHDHYDHLDHETIKFLDDMVEKYFVPLGVGARLVRWGVKRNKIKEFDWYEKSDFGPFEFVFVPGRHFSGRGLFDRMKTLWGGWIIKSKNQKIFFSGDSSFFDEFTKIGEQFGPFEIAFVECGTYDKNWKDLHATPEETVQIAIDLKAKVLMPIHNAKFDLARHPWKEPLERVLKESEKRGIALATPLVGESFSLNPKIPQNRWWRDLK